MEGVFFAVRADIPAFSQPGYEALIILFDQAVKYEVHLVDSGAPRIVHEGRRVSRISAAEVDSVHDLRGFGLRGI